MNTKNGKCGVFAALTAALLVTAALITSCPAPEVVTVYKDGYQPPAGMGYITIKPLEFTGQRTVLPSAGAWISYDLSIQKYDALGPSGTVEKTTSYPNYASLNSSTRINLAPGFYTVTVTAYTAVGSAGKAAVGTSTRFTISAGQGQDVEVTLKPLPYTETGDGTFEYAITVSSGITVSGGYEITITPQGGGTDDYDNPDTAALSDTFPLKPDSYIVFLEATVGSEKASIIEVVNIHQNLTSTATFFFDGRQFLAYIDGITVDFNPGEIKPGLIKSDSTPIINGTEITLSLQDGDTEDITITNADLFDSIDWYCGSPVGYPVALPAGTFEIEAGAGPFVVDEPKAYPVTVVGKATADGRYYSQKFMVIIVD